MSSSRGYQSVGIEHASNPRQYQRRRKEKYPETWEDEAPSRSCDRDYRAYRELKDKSDTSRARYIADRQTYKDRSKPVYAVAVPNEYSHHHRQLHGLEPQFHRELVEPSWEAGNDALRSLSLPKSTLFPHTDV